ncbi:MAG: PP2C family protein-serine/threonine phosphatase [Thermomicrobiales bacterium]
MGKSVPGDSALAVRRALVVDDDPDINRLVRVRLTTRGYQVASAANGEEALRLLADEPFDLLFLDVSMPGIGGLEVLDTVRERALDLAVIMMTAFGSEQVAIEALRRGADDYLRKPFERNEFHATLDRTVRRLELSRQNAWLQAQLDDKRQQLEAELARASVVQADLLPDNYPAIPPFELAACCKPARDVGGDFYDWQAPAPGCCWLTLADVMGKGMPAALWMATVRTAMRAVVRTSPPAEAMAYVAAALDPDLDRADAYVTLFLAQLDIAARRLAYVDAGHGHVFIRRADGRAEPLPCRGLPLGIQAGVPFQEGTVEFAPGDALVLYSDGLTDARPDLRGDQAMLAGHLAGARHASEMVERLVALGANGPLPDDLTVVALLLPATAAVADSQ